MGDVRTDTRERVRCVDFANGASARLGRRRARDSVRRVSSPRSASRRVTSSGEGRRAERRTALLAAARDVFAERGYAAATVDDVVARAGVARGTFYLYFKDKRDVFRALVDEMMRFLGEGLLAHAPTEERRAISRPPTR